MIKLLSVKSLSVAVVALLCFGGIANGVTKNVKNTALPVAVYSNMLIRKLMACSASGSPISFFTKPW